MHLFFLLVLFLCFHACSSYFFVTWPELHKVKTVEDFHANVGRILEEFPCEDCRIHFENLVNTHMMPLEHVKTIEEARLWMYLAHNSVNLRIGKEWAPLEILKQYENTC